MRLICPNCDAKYEVDASLIPSSGRDVQCSNCGKTWFQEPVDTLRLTPADEVSDTTTEENVVAEEEHEPAEVGAEEVRSGDGLGSEAREFFAQSEQGSATDGLIDEEEPGFVPSELPEESHEEFEAAVQEATDDLIDESREGAVEAAMGGGEGPLDFVPPEPDYEPEPNYHHEPDDAQRFEPVHEHHHEPEYDQEPAASETTVEPELERPPVDSAVLGILKAEAEREIAARRAEEAGVETQPDLGLSEPENRSEPELERDRSEIEARTARLRGEEEEADTIEDAVRRTVLPDVEEINSTLTATTERAVADDAAAAAVQVAATQSMHKRRVGFRFGFSAVIMATAALILLYLYAPQIAEAMPEATPALTAYVDWANGVRQTVDVLLTDGVERLTTILVSLTT